MIKLIVYERGSEAWDLALLEGVNTSFLQRREKKKKKQVSGKPSGRGGRSQGLNEVLRAIK